MKKIAILGFAILALSSSLAQAASVTGKITVIRNMGNLGPTEYYVKIVPASGVPVATPCAPAAATFNYMFNTAGGAHPRTLDILLSAYAKGSTTVTLTGTDICTPGGTIEILEQVTLR